jgi:CRP/FNR family transcriptional regulator, cyclic AMP receptor protein
MVPFKATPLLNAGSTYRDQMVALIGATRLFGDMKPWDQEALSEYLEAWRVESGQTIFVEGQPGKLLAVVVAGRVEIVKTSEFGLVHSVAELTTGMALGEMSLIDGEPRSATARMAETGTLLVLQEREFNRLLLDRPALAFHIMKKLARSLSQKLRQTTGRLMDYLDTDF